MRFWTVPRWKGGWGREYRILTVIIVLTGLRSNPHLDKQHTKNSMARSPCVLVINTSMNLEYLMTLGVIGHRVFWLYSRTLRAGTGAGPPCAWFRSCSAEVHTLCPSSYGSQLHRANSIMPHSCARSQNIQTDSTVACNTISAAHKSWQAPPYFPEIYIANDSRCVCDVLLWVTVSADTAARSLPESVVAVATWQYDWYLS